MKVEIELSYTGEQSIDEAIIDAAAERVIDYHMRRDEAFETITATRDYYQAKCDKAGLTAEQAAQVIAYRLDPWWCSSDKPADEVVDFFRWLNEDAVRVACPGDRALNAVLRVGTSGLLEVSS